MADASFGPSWPVRNPYIVPLSVGGVDFPGGIHSSIHDLVVMLLIETQRRGYRLVPGWCWGYANRAIAGTATASNHSTGTSIDINAPKNPMGPTLITDMPDWMPVMWKHYGFRWGGNYQGKKDAMHYEFMGTTADAVRFTEMARRDFYGQPSQPVTAIDSTAYNYGYGY